MTPFLLSLALAAGPAPVAPAKANVVFAVQRPSADLPPVRAFLLNAAGYAPSLRPSALGRSLGTPLGADVTDPASLADAGVDVDAPLTVSSTPGAGLLTCFSGKGKKAQERLDAFLGAGKKTQSSKGVALYGVETAKAWRAGYAKKGGLICAAAGGGDVLPLLKLAAEAMAGSGVAGQKAFRQAVAGLKGKAVLFTQLRSGTAAFDLDGSAERLGLSGRVVGQAAMLDKPRDADPLAAISVEAPFVATATLAPKLLTDPKGPVAMALGYLSYQACRSCDAAIERALTAALAPQLAGPLALVVSRLDTSAIGQPAGQYFLAPHAYLFAVKDAAAVSKALSAAMDGYRAGGATVSKLDSPQGTQFSVSLGKRQVLAGVEGALLYVANDANTLAQALKAASEAKPSKPSHAATARLDGARAAAALSRISILDVAKGPELAALFGLGLEAGPLLRAAGVVAMHADPETGSATHVETEIRLPKPLETEIGK